MYCKAQRLLPGDCITINDTPKLRNSVAIVLSRHLRPRDSGLTRNQVLIGLLLNVGGALSVVARICGRDEELAVIERAPRI